MKLKELITEMPYAEIKHAEDDIDKLFRDIGLDVEFSKHFKDRISDDSYDSRDSDVTYNELFKAFKELKDKYGQYLINARQRPKEFIAILKDATTNLNIPFSIDYDKIYNGLHKLKAFTLMRKKNFVPNKTGEKILTIRTEK